ncbi:hypothetical protein JNB_05430 [Janibacter sp. HTCC2649]|nr:hypothetical protein JNB_05430 [Janibacter sp. HTCC2649]
MLAAAGIAGVLLIGSDDTVDSPATTLKLGDAKAVVSTPSLLAFTNTTMRLTAESSDGTVFLGQAHPIDARSYLATSSTYAVTKVDTSGLSGEVVKGDPKTALPDPTKQGFWTARATGTGKQTLMLELDGTPTEFVIMPVGKGGDLTVTSGIQVKNGFTLSLAALVVGVLALFAGLLLRRRRRAVAESGSENGPVAKATAAAGDEVDRATEVDAPATPSGTMGRVFTLGVISALVPALAGCGVVPTKVDAWKTSELTKPAMANQAEALAAMKDLDARSATSRAAIATSYDAKQWSAVRGGPLLATAVLGTQFDQLVKDHSVAKVSFTVHDAYLPAFSSYPMFAMVSGTETINREKPNEALQVITRSSVTSPWVLVGATTAQLKGLAAPAASGTPSTLTPADLKQTKAAVDGLTSQINTGKGSPALPKELGEYFAGLRTPTQGSATLKAEPWNPTKDLVSPDGSVQAVKTTTGQLVVVSYNLLVTQTAKAGYVFLDDPKNQYRTVTGQTGDLETVLNRYALIITMQLDKNGKPSVIGDSAYYVR